MTTNTDVAREAALATEFSAIWNQELEDANCAPRMNIGYDPEVVAGKAMKRAYELGKAGSLTTAIEGADEKLAEIRERNKALGGHFPRNTLSTMHLWANELYADNTALLTLVTALSAKAESWKAAWQNEVQKSNEAVAELESKLTAQKAAHAKMLRDEAPDWRGHPIAGVLRSLADKIEGGE